MTKKKFLILSLAGLIFINVVLYFNGSLVASGTSTTNTWEPGYEITLVLPLLLLATYLIIRYSNRTIKIILAEVIVIVVLYSTMLSINSDRIANDKVPLYLWKTTNKTEVLNEVIYHGVGYKVVDKYYSDGETTEDTTTIYNIFNSTVTCVGFIEVIVR